MAEVGAGDYRYVATGSMPELVHGSDDLSDVSKWAIDELEKITSPRAERVHVDSTEPPSLPWYLRYNRPDEGLAGEPGFHTACSLKRRTLAIRIRMQQAAKRLRVLSVYSRRPASAHK